MAWGAGTAVAVAEDNGARHAHAGAFADCPELDCLVGQIDAKRLAAARRRAFALGTGADRVLIASGAISEHDYLRALADDIGIVFAPLSGLPRSCSPLDDARIIDTAAAGLLTIVENGLAQLLIAPRGLTARRVATIVREKPDFARFCRLTTSDDFDRFVLRAAGKALSKRAAHALRQSRPRMSAAPPARRVIVMPVAIAVGAVLITASAAVTASTAPVGLSAACLALLFASWLGLRIVAATTPPREPAPSPRLPDHALPDYTVICALYNEAASTGALLAAIAGLDYPPEKLQIIFALEPDDRETRAAIEARKGPLPVTLVTVPPGGPRTKPRALNAALPFARGSFTVIFDAEDRPQPGQLRTALQAFAAGGGRLACVQARLCIDNTADGWLPRIFTAEYAGQFDVFLPGLSAMDLPLPLGGSSNHFRTETLRKAGGWDAYNVTEDADLGMRLARLGYRVATIASTTFEEAPARLRAWVHQRTRWFKGWMQTWAVHTSDLPRLTRDLGFTGVICFQLSVGGNALAALIHPLVLMTLLGEAVLGKALPWRDSGAGAVLAVFYGAIALAGYLVSALLGWMGLIRRGLHREAWALLLMPVYWLLLSVAAWRALYQLVADPYAWEKTEHGLAKTSRLAASTTRALIKLERHLTYLEDSGRLALPGNTGKQTTRIRDIRKSNRPAAAARRPSRRQSSGSLRHALPFLFFPDE